MEILAVELKSGVAGNNFVAFVGQSIPGWRKLAHRDGRSSLKLLKATIRSLKHESVVVAEGCCPDSPSDGLTAFCEVFYDLDYGQWFV
jgi:hypothetical protein